MKKEGKGYGFWMTFLGFYDWLVWMRFCYWGFYMPLVDMAMIYSVQWDD